MKLATSCYLYDYASIKEAKVRLKNYFKFYNYERHHQALDYKKPAEVYFKDMPVDYMNYMDNELLVPRSLVTHTIHVDQQAQQQ